MNSYLRADADLRLSALTCIIQVLGDMSIRPAHEILFTGFWMTAVPQNKSPTGNGSVPSLDGAPSISS